MLKLHDGGSGGGQFAVILTALMIGHHASSPRHGFSLPARIHRKTHYA
jgi:hypothetical protein